MNASKWIRQTHRWLSIVFTITVLANFAAMTQGPPPAWITYSPLPPLALLLFSGLYMFALPYAAKWRSARRVASRVGVSFAPRERASVKTGYGCC